MKLVKKEAELLLDFGDVKNLAEVFVNGNIQEHYGIKHFVKIKHHLSNFRHKTLNKIKYVQERI